MIAIRCPLSVNDRKRRHNLIYCRDRLAEQRYGHLNLISCRNYQLIVARMTLSSCLQNTFSEIHLYCRCRILHRNSCHDIFKRVSHVLDELRCELWHGMAPDMGYAVFLIPHASWGHEHETFITHYPFTIYRPLRMCCVLSVAAQAYELIKKWKKFGQKQKHPSNPDSEHHNSVNDRLMLALCRE